MKENELKVNETVVNNGKKFRKLINPTNKNWPRISINDFGIRYSQDFIDTKKKEKVLWKNSFLQKSIGNSQGE